MSDATRVADRGGWPQDTPTWSEPPAWSIGPARLLATGNHATRPAHPRLRLLDRAQLIQDLDIVGLLGRGGADFPAATKLRSMPKRGDMTVVANGSEGEPASHKDRVLMRRAPHLVLDGAVVVAHALAARRVLVAVDDWPSAVAMHTAASSRPDGADIRVVHTDGGFVGGEARAVLRALEGGPALPPGRRILPTERGYRGTPTFLSNVETFAQIALLAALGPRGYAETGITDEPGTSLLTVTGAVGRPGVVELPHGAPLSVLLTEVQAAPGSSILLGGYHGTWWSGDHDLLLSRPILRAAGATLGAGVVAVLGPDSCPVGELARVTNWLAGESAGQCGPCVFGLPALARDLQALYNGTRGGSQDVRRHLAVMPGRGACAHPDGAARFVASGLQTFVKDVELHRSAGHCGRPVRGHLPLSTTWQET